MRGAIDRGDAAALKTSAHRLKGSIGNFAAPRAFRAALLLEEIANKGDLAPASATFEDLTSALTDLESGLSRLAQGTSP